MIVADDLWIAIVLVLLVLILLAVTGHLKLYLSKTRVPRHGTGQAP